VTGNNNNNNNNNDHATQGLSFLNAAKTGLNLEDIGSGCSNVTTAGPRVAYITPLNPANDPWNYYGRALTFQVPLQPTCALQMPLLSVDHLQFKQDALFFVSK